MLNNKQGSWLLTDGDYYPIFDLPVLALIEHDVVNAPDEDLPFVRKARLIKGDPWRWELLDYDPATEEQYLQQCFTVVAWRYV